MKSKYFMLVLVAGAGARSAVACDLCSVYAASEAQGGGGTGFYGGVAEQFSRFNTLQVQSRKVANDGEYIDSSVSQVFLGYNFNNRYGAQINVPIIARAYGSTGGGNLSESGIGDISVIGNVRLWQTLTEDFTFNWTALGGIKLPTGDYHHLNPDEPDFADGIGGHDLTLGSGSVDGIIGTGAVLRWKRVFFDASVQYAIRSEGGYDYQFDNDLSWTAGPGVYLALNHKCTFAIQAVCSGEFKGQDRVQGIQTTDTAETAVYVGPQVHFTWGRDFSAQLGVDVPVKISSSGEQLVPDYRLHGAVTFRF